MKMKNLSVLIVCVIGFIGCASATSSVKGTMATVNTEGNSYEAIIILENSAERLIIAKDDGGFILYANIMTSQGNRGGDLFFIIDGNRVNIGNWQDWNIDSTVTNYHGTFRFCSLNKKLSDNVINSLLNANNVIVRAINGSAFMGKNEGVDISTILSNIKSFISN